MDRIRVRQYDNDQFRVDNLYVNLATMTPQDAEHYLSKLDASITAQEPKIQLAKLHYEQAENKLAELRVLRERVATRNEQLLSTVRVVQQHTGQLQQLDRDMAADLVASNTGWEYEVVVLLTGEYNLAV